VVHTKENVYGMRVSLGNSPVQHRCVWRSTTVVVEDDKN